MFGQLKQNKSLFTWMPAVIWAFVILVLSILPGETFPDIAMGHLDKWIHFFEYALLALLLVRGIHYGFSGSSPLRDFLFILILGGGYGILIELIQWFVPGRELSVWDAASNIAGIVVGIVLGKGVIWRR